jgi:hypothetical protein
MADHRVLLAASGKFTEVGLMAAVGKGARTAAGVPDIEEAAAHLGASVVSFQLLMDLSYRMQLCCRDLLHQIEV